MKGGETKGGRGKGEEGRGWDRAGDRRGAVRWSGLGRREGKEFR